METILLAWNPKNFPWGSFKDELAAIRRDGRARQSWSVGNRTTVRPGTRFFLIRLGSEPRGLVGSGWTTSAPFKDDHWNQDRARSGKTAQYVEIDFDVLEEFPIVTMPELKERPFASGHWSTQISGVRVSDSIAVELENVWAKRTTKKVGGGREELQSVPKTALKHSMRVLVNRHERCARMRSLCLAHYGMKCACCGVLLADIYGDQAADVIHVHHLSPLGALPSGTVIDPIRDLRPVCPNCHCVIHTRPEPFTIREMKALLATRKKVR